MNLPRFKPYLTWPLLVFGLWLLTLVLLSSLITAFSDRHINPLHLFNYWDNGWYQTIVQDGYHITPGQQSNVAFFPLYPLLVKAVTAMGLSVVQAGVTVSLISFAAALVTTFALVRKRVGSKEAQITCLLLAFFPFSFFFGLLYTEALFLLLVVATLLFLDTHKWWPAAIAAGLAGATRVTGLLLLVVVIGTYLDSCGKLSWRNAMRALGLGVVSSLGMLAYMGYLQKRFGDALAFFHVQQYWPGRGNGLDGLVVVLHRLKEGPIFSNPYALNLTEVSCLVVFGLLSVYVFLRLNRWWGFFCIASLAVPLITGTTVSLNRYVIVLAPCFIAAGKLLKTPGRALFVITPSAMLLAQYFQIFYSTSVFLG